MGTEECVLERSFFFYGLAERAKGLALSFGESTAVRRCGEEWHLVVPRRVADAVLDDVALTMASNSISDDESVYEAWQAELHDELLSEMDDDMEMYALSDEAGWFYPDR